MANLFQDALDAVHAANRAFRHPVRWKMHPHTLIDLMRTQDEDGNIIGATMEPNAPRRLLGYPIEEVPSIAPGKLALLCREDT